MPRKSTKQAAAIEKVNEARRKKTGRYAFRIGPFVRKLENEGLSQRQIVDVLNDAGAVVPSEFKPENRHAPRPIKKWSLSQYQRFRALIDKAEQKMAWHAKR